MLWFSLLSPLLPRSVYSLTVFITCNFFFLFIEYLLSHKIEATRKGLDGERITLIIQRDFYNSTFSIVSASPFSVIFTYLLVSFFVFLSRRRERKIMEDLFSWLAFCIPNGPAAKVKLTRWSTLLVKPSESPENHRQQFIRLEGKLLLH